MCLDVLENELTVQEFLAVAHKIDELAALNYSKKKTTAADSVRIFFESMGILVPVTTDSPQ